MPAQIAKPEAAPSYQAVISDERPFVNARELMRLAVHFAKVERGLYASGGHATTWAQCLAFGLRKVWDYAKMKRALLKAHEEFRALPVHEQHARQLEARAWQCRNSFDTTYRKDAPLHEAEAARIRAEAQQERLEAAE